MTQYLFTQSLGKTLDAVNEAYFFGRAIPKSERVNVAKWIANRQGLPNSYANMFAPTEKDMKEGGSSLYRGKNRIKCWNSSYSWRRSLSSINSFRGSFS